MNEFVLSTLDTMTERKRRRAVVVARRENGDGGWDVVGCGCKGVCCGFHERTIKGCRKSMIQQSICIEMFG
jgi:hypothetical protein